MTYGQAVRNGILKGPSKKDTSIACSVVNWNRCVERAALIAEESREAIAEYDFEEYQDIRDKHGKTAAIGKAIARKIRQLSVDGL